MVVVVLVFDVRGKRIDGLKLRLAEGFAGFSQRYTASKAMNTNWGLLERRIWVFLCWFIRETWSEDSEHGLEATPAMKEKNTRLESGVGNLTEGSVSLLLLDGLDRFRSNPTSISDQSEIRLRSWFPELVIKCDAPIVDLWTFLQGTVEMMGRLYLTVMVVSRQWSGVDEASIRLWIYGWSVSEGGSDVVTFCGIFELFLFLFFFLNRYLTMVKKN